MKRNAEQNAKALAFGTINKIESVLSNIEYMNRNNAYLIGNRILLDKEQDMFFHHQIIDNDEIISICVAYTPEYSKVNKTARSQIYYVSKSQNYIIDIQANISEYTLSDWFIIPYDKRKDYWSEPWIDINVGTQPITSFSTPIYKGNEIIGIIRADVSLKVLQQIVSSVKVLKTGYAIMLTSNGTFVTHPADSLILNYTIFSYADQLSLPELKVIGREMLNGRSKFEKLPVSRQYISRWIYYAPISLNKWSLGVKFKDNEIMGDLVKVNYVFALILSFGFLLLLSLIYTRITTIFKPLNSLVKVTNKIGSGDFDVQLPETKMLNEVSLLTDSFGKMQKELKNYMTNMIKTNSEKEKIASEIRIAAQIQQSIIPSDRELLSDIGEVSIFGILEPSEEIGGDLYDAFMIDDTNLCFVIADVFGNGIVASMIMTMVQTLVRSQSKYSRTAVSLVKDINSYMCENNKQSNFVTMVVGILDLKTGVLEYCNAGHTPIYVRNSDRKCIRYPQTHCTALGMFPDLNVESSTIKLNAQDFLIMFTDGITEAISEKDAFFGYDRLESTICDLQNPTPESIVKAILQEIRKFTGLTNQNDDLSVLVLKFNHPRLK